MRHQGRLTEWNDDRGFGFITPLDGESRVFVHVSEFPGDKRRPMAMDLVTYIVGRDDRGRSRATDVLYMAPTSSKRLTPKATSRISKRSIVVLAAVGVSIIAFGGAVSVLTVRASQGLSTSSAAGSVSARPSTSGDQILASAFQQRTSGLQVTGGGVVERVLSDDNDGSRHQRFILRLASGQTLMVAHNIDLAPRLTSLSPGDSVNFNGVYEWNPEGGVIHWTHHDPDGQHVPGWLQYQGATYQ